MSNPSNALYLHSNEGRPSLEDVGESTRRYPDASELEQRLATRFGIDADRILVTAGGDDAILRACLTSLDSGLFAIVPVPTFEMIPRYIEMTGARIQKVDWIDDSFPIEQVIEAVSDRTGLIALVSPNNPTGAVATADDLMRISRAAPHATLLVDLAYTEFADVDLTDVALSLDNAIIIRTFSKAYGLAGLRVGYALGTAAKIAGLRRTGNPYPVAGPSLDVAARALAQDPSPSSTFVGRVQTERRELEALLNSLGARAYPSQANYVFARSSKATWIKEALRSVGISVRTFPDRDGLKDAIRITCPGDERDFRRLGDALLLALRPQALLFDLDGVIADVSRSYRATIIETAQAYGMDATADDIAVIKREGDANDDWEVTRRLLQRGGKDVSLTSVRDTFERIYQGTPSEPGLHRLESLRIGTSRLRGWAKSFPLAIVTGRPRSDTERFLASSGIRELFSAVVCREDGPLKPDPTPVRVAMNALGIERAWMLGDTMDDIQAARGANALAIGVIAPGDDPAETKAHLLQAGAALCFDYPTELEALLS